MGTEASSVPTCVRDDHLLLLVRRASGGRGTRATSASVAHHYSMHLTCPTCQALLAFSPDNTLGLGADGLDETQQIQLAVQRCTNSDCRAQILHRRRTPIAPPAGPVPVAADEWQLVYPRRPVRRPADSSVPTSFAVDYSEACAVLNDSPKASAALARRCLQSVLREMVGKQASLEKEIDEATSKLPSDLASDLHGLRHLGNFAAHPMKDTMTAAIVDVEPGEAEWTLDLVDSLFDYVYVAPQQRSAMRAAVNAKLAAAGKPPLP